MSENSSELQDAGKSKDAANKRCLQKLEHTNQDLEEAIKKIKNWRRRMIKKILEKIKNLWDKFVAWLFSWQK